jgi:SAM-dependent methyltransferase
MHTTAMQNCRHFFDCYGQAIGESRTGQEVTVVEIGSQDVNGSIRSCCPSRFRYVGVDFVAGKGVDVVLDDPYVLPFPSESVDVVLSSSCLEHSEMFWLAFLEMMRILRPSGLLYLNVPSNGSFHRYPVDCWRFYPDSGRALVAWARRNGVQAALLESYVSLQSVDQWNDFVAVIARSEEAARAYPGRILHSKTDISNGIVDGGPEFVKMHELPEDLRKLSVIGKIVNDQIKLV